MIERVVIEAVLLIETITLYRYKNKLNIDLDNL